MYFKLLILFLFPIVVCSADLPNNKKFTLSVCAIFKNEARYLKEWIEYHRLIGVDHFYLYENNSKDKYRVALNPYIKKGIVTLISWPDYFESHAGEFEPQWVLSTMVSAYEHAIRFQAVGETKWLTILNINEFLLPSNGETLTQLLERYENYPGIILSSYSYDSSKRHPISKNSLIIEAACLTHSPKTIPFNVVEKTIFKPEKCASFTWPPIKYKFKEKELAKTVSCYEARVNSYWNRGYSTIQASKHKLLIDHRTFLEEELNQILDQGYEIEDREKQIHQYIPELRKKMGFAPELN